MVGRWNFLLKCFLCSGHVNFCGVTSSNGYCSIVIYLHWYTLMASPRLSHQVEHRDGDAANLMFHESVGESQKTRPKAWLLVTNPHGPSFRGAFHGWELGCLFQQLLRVWTPPIGWCWYIDTGWWFQIFFIFTPTWGRFQFDWYFSKGLKAPTRICFYISSSIHAWKNPLEYLTRWPEHRKLSCPGNHRLRLEDVGSLYGCFRFNSGFYPQIIPFNRVFHYKPSIWGTPIFGITHIVYVYTFIWVFPKIGVPQMDGLSWKTLLKWMIWGYHHFWKHPYPLFGNSSAIDTEKTGMTLNQRPQGVRSH